jgi:UDP-N-acetylmuramate dehydrogenase
MKNNLVSALPSVKGKYRLEADLSKMCWFGVGGKAEVLFIPNDAEDLAHFLSNVPRSIPINIIGVGSNVVFKDGIIEGVTIRLGRGFNFLNIHDEFEIAFGCAVMDLNLALFAAQHSVAGMEFFSGIPGTMGGALAMNAGAYGGETAEVLLKARGINIRTGVTREFTAADFGFFYRGNSLDKDWIFIDGIAKGRKGEQHLISSSIDEIQSKRSSTQPIRSKTGGSTFKNPSGMKAWELIDKAGCRGFRIGGASISELHCNFLINDGTATSDDIINLIHEVKNRVFSTSGIHLEAELKVIG